jgi:hypothetical protein
MIGSNRFLCLLAIACALFQSTTLSAQKVKIIGHVYHAEDPTFNLLVVNKRTSLGVFGNKSGAFEIFADKNDTILVGALGYVTEKICMGDSVAKSEYKVAVYVRPIAYELKEVSIFPQRELVQIQEDIRKLGYDDRDYMLSGIDVLHSPLTFLYQQVSRQERMKREAYQYINEERRRDLLKELFSKYVSNDIIELDRDEFEDFVDFVDVSEYQMKAMTQYEFIIFIKQRFQAFRNTPPRLRQDIDTHD